MVYWPSQPRATFDSLNEKSDEHLRREVGETHWKVTRSGGDKLRRRCKETGSPDLEPEEVSLFSYKVTCSDALYPLWPEASLPEVVRHLWNFTESPTKQKGVLM